MHTLRHSFMSLFSADSACFRTIIAGVMAAFLVLVIPGRVNAQMSVQEEWTTDGLRVAFDFSWDESLHQFVDSSGVKTWSHGVLDAATGGQLFASHLIELPGLAPASLRIVERLVNEVAVAIDIEERDPLSDRDAVWMSEAGVQRKKAVANIVLMPFRLDANRGVMERMRRVVVDITFGTSPSEAFSVASKGASRVTESALSDGNLFRISIQDAGVYRVTRTLLQSLGVDPDTIDPQQIQILSNGGRPLPVIAGAERIDDLRESPVLRSGAGDGRFDAADAVTFYASGPSGWQVEDSQMQHYVHPFSNENAVILKVGAFGQDIVQQTDPSTANAATFTSTQGRHFIDWEEAVWSREHGSGHDWMSNRIRVGSERSLFTGLELPGMLAGSVLFEARVAIASNPRATVAMISDGVTLGQRTAPTTTLNGSEYPTASVTSFNFVQSVTQGQLLNLSMRLLQQNNEPEAAIDWLRLTYERGLSAQEGMLTFMTRPNQGIPQRFSLSGFASTPIVWDVTDGIVHHSYLVESVGGTQVVHVPLQGDGSAPRELIAFTEETVQTLFQEQVRAVVNQNLHGISDWPDLLIVTVEGFLPAANRLAEHRRSQGLIVQVVTQEQVFNEFSGGVADMRAVRDYAKFLYDRTNDPDRMLDYLLLFGDGHYDFRGLSGFQNPLSNHIFPYETAESAATAASYTSDDYFGLLDDNEGEWVFTSIFNGTFERLDIGVGRLPLQTVAESDIMVDKLIAYDDPATFGSWRTTYTAIADDGPTGLAATQNDADLHLSNIDQVAELITDEAFPKINMQKIYGETYDRVFLGGYKIPEARRDILDAIDRGTLVLNYSGHGGPDGLAQEGIFTRDDARLLTNGVKQPIVITATCSFGWWDLEEEQSGAEVMLLNPDGGAIALLTAVRLAYTSSSQTSLNAGLNRALNITMFEMDDRTGQPRRLGDILRITKNTEVGLQGNSRKFNLLGDPSMRIGLPAGNAVVEKLKETDLDNTQGQLKALDRVTVNGSIRTPEGVVDASFNGLVNVAVFDAERQVPIKQRIYNPKLYFREREDLLWRGEVSATSGRFEAEFVVPKDISYTNLPGRIAVYARDGNAQAIGYSENFLVGGTSDNPPDDGEGPQMRLFLNDTTFVDGGSIDGDPELIVRLFDESGINTVGAGVGHEILLSVDDDDQGAVDIGSAFVSSPNSFREGEIRWNLTGLEAGQHTLSVRAWDVLNNSNSSDLSFSLATDEVLDVHNVYNYPNPMNRETRFVFEHNQPSGTPAEVQIRIFTLSGRPIRTIHSDEALPEGILGSGPLVVHWDGKDDDLDRPATGIYLYRIRVAVDRENGERQVSEHVEKLAIIH